MGRIYTSRALANTAVASYDLWEVYDAAKTICLYEIGVSQETMVGNQQEVMNSLALKSGQTVAGSGSQIMSVVQRLPGDIDANTTSLRWASSTKASGGTIVTHYSWYWNVRYPFRHVFEPSKRPVFRPGRRFTLELTKPSAVLMSHGYYLIFEERN